SGSVSHFIRGKNPLDADVISYLGTHLEQRFQRIALPILRHETRQRKYLFNQFNSGAKLTELPNYGYPGGWGISQIDRTGSEGDKTITTDEVWNWKTNVNLVNGVLREKSSMALSFVSRFRKEYGQTAQWSEPTFEFSLPEYPSVSLQPIEWSEVVLYNGTNGVPASVAAGYRFASPLVFSTEKGWLFYDNNNQYAHRIAQEMVRMQNNEQTKE
ncbi:MAG: hypothetical protein ACI4QT_05135, partial [Kiritimatiellia bacterium]